MESYSERKIALDCGFDPTDSVLVAYLPKLDAMMQEYDVSSDEKLLALDGIAIDIVASRAVRWWRVRNAAFVHKLAHVELICSRVAASFSLEYVEWLRKTFPPNDGRMHMRAYSRGPWICIEPDQLEKVYTNEDNLEGTVLHI